MTTNFEILKVPGLSTKETPIITSLIDNESEGLQFTLSNIDVCFANAIRRTILSDIDICCILSDKHERNEVFIEINTGRLHNEILKQRLSCIPVHFNGKRSEMEVFCRDFKLEIDCKNDSNEMKIITTEDFHVVNKLTGVEIKTEKIFCPDVITSRFIDFSRLRPKISDSIPGEALKLYANFSISNAKDNSMYNVVSKCTYSNTIDEAVLESRWVELKKEHQSKGLTEDEISFEKKNFYLLDGQRCFKQNSFDFTIKGLGIFTEIALMKLSCQVLISKLKQICDDVLIDNVPILVSETTMKNSFDIILVNEDYTIGKMLEYILYTKFFVSKKPLLNYCGFKKFHPHDAKSTIRVAFNDDKSINPRQLLHYACEHAILTLQSINW